LSLNAFCQNPPDSTIADQYFQIGDSLIDQGKYDLAIENFEKARSLYKNLEQWSDYIDCHINISNMHRKAGRFELAKSTVISSINLCKKYEIGAHEVSARAYNSLGTIYYMEGDFKKAREYYQTSFHLNIQLFGKEHKSISVGYNNFGVVHYALEEYEQALSYFKKSVEFKAKITGKNYLSLANAYNNIGVIMK